MQTKAELDKKKSGKSGWKIPGLIHLVGHEGNPTVQWSMKSILWFRLLMKSKKAFFLKFYHVWFNINHSSVKKLKLGSPFIPTNQSTLTALSTDAHKWVKQHRKYAFIRMLCGFSAPVCSKALYVAGQTEPNPKKSYYRTQNFSPHKKKPRTCLGKMEPFHVVVYCIHSVHQTHTNSTTTSDTTGLPRGWVGRENKQEYRKNNTTNALVTERERERESESAWAISAFVLICGSGRIVNLIVLWN